MAFGSRLFLLRPIILMRTQPMMPIAEHTFLYERTHTRAFAVHAHTHTHLFSVDTNHRQRSHVFTFHRRAKFKCS